MNWLIDHRKLEVVVSNTQTGEQLHRPVLESIVDSSNRLVKACIIRDATDPVAQEDALGVIPD